MEHISSSPILQAPDTVSGVHIAVELTGSGLVRGDDRFQPEAFIQLADQNRAGV